MRDHTKLRAFDLADEVVTLIYRVTRKFPKEEICGLSSQLRRAAVPVPSNMGEGCAREGEVEYLRFLEIAFSSLEELHYHLSLAKRLGYLNSALFLACDARIEETKKGSTGIDALNP